MTEHTDIERAIAELRHLYAQMVNGAVIDSAQAKSIAEGLLSRSIACLEQASHCVPSAAPTPPVAQERPPLTDERIREIDDETHFHESPSWPLRFARAIEAAHDIK